MYSDLMYRHRNMTDGNFDYMNVSSESDSSDLVSNMTFNPAFRMAFSVIFYRYMFIVMYSVIFIVCIVGNTLVLIVTARSVRMKTRTNFFLANLAAADLCVGILCILPNLQTFLYFSWLLGTTMCKVYYFAESFSFCASVLFLVVIAVERYIAVMHSLKAKGLFTTCRMHTAQVLIWVFSAVYNIPLLAIFDTFVAPNRAGGITVFCNVRQDVIDLKTYYTINFVLWYVLPLITMSVVYAIISWTLWHSGTIFSYQKNNDTISNASCTKVTPIIREQRSSCNASSSSSYSDTGSGSAAPVGDCIQRENGGSVICDVCRYSSPSSMKVRSCYSYSEDLSDRVPLSGDEVPGRPQARSSGSRNDLCDLTPSMLPQYEYNSPVYRLWYSSQETGRNDDVRNFRQNSFANRLFGSQNYKYNTIEMARLAPTCLHYQRSHNNRDNGIVHQILPLINPKRRPTRRSFHSDADSSPSQTTSEATVHRRQPSMSDRVLSSRRKVVRLLVLILLTFAICVLPHHVRLLMFYWNVYPLNSYGMSFFPPLAFISLYLNSALNPVLYSLFSESFRRSLRECLRRACQRVKSLFTKRSTSCCPGP